MLRRSTPAPGEGKASDGLIAELSHEAANLRGLCDQLRFIRFSFRRTLFRHSTPRGGDIESEAAECGQGPNPCNH